MNKKKLEKKIRKMFKNASTDDCGVPCVYETEVLNKLCGIPYTREAAVENSHVSSWGELLSQYQSLFDGDHNHNYETIIMDSIQTIACKDKDKVDNMTDMFLVKHDNGAAEGSVQ